MTEKINILKKLINSIRDLRKQTIKSDDLNSEQLYYLQEGYREGLCSSAMILADELDATLQECDDCPDNYPIGMILNFEENWWHTHVENDKGSDHRW